MLYTSSHSLAELNGLAVGMVSSVAVTCTRKQKIVLEYRRGMFMQTRLIPSSGQTLMGLCATPVEGIYSCHNIDSSQQEDWDFCRNRLSRPQDVRRFDSLVRAMDLCKQAEAMALSDPGRKELVEQAIEMSPDLCAHAYHMRLELLSIETAGGDRNDSKEHQLARIAKDGVIAGRAFANLIRADEFCKGNLYNFVPCRWFMRCLYVLGSLLLSIGNLEASDQYLKEYLANDIHDKLGARHKQLLVSLERDQGLGGEEITFLLKAAFGDDQNKDTTLALWNYTRALHAFGAKGDCKASRKLINEAISKNPYVPPLLLAWELSMEGQELMEVGGNCEAGDYVTDNMKYWLNVNGALEWLEEVYGEENVVSPIIKDKGKMRLYVEGTRLMGEKGTVRRAIDRFERLLAILNRDEGADRTACCSVLRRLALCHNMLSDHDAALRHINSALCVCPPTDKDAIKELFYNRAGCKENKGDLAGALQDYTFVFQRLGTFTVAERGIARLEAKLNTQTSALPPCPDIGVVENANDLRKVMADVSKLLPVIDPKATVAATLERCSHCQRGGIKLAKCSGCDGARYCSRDCQRAGWKKIHKFVCKSSKNRLESGTMVRLHGLENARQHNGKTATIVRFLEEKGRFSIELEREEGHPSVTLSVRPQNLEKVGVDAGRKSECVD